MSGNRMVTTPLGKARDNLLPENRELAIEFLDKVILFMEALQHRLPARECDCQALEELAKEAPESALQASEPWKNYRTTGSLPGDLRRFRGEPTEDNVKRILDRARQMHGNLS